MPHRYKVSVYLAVYCMAVIASVPIGADELATNRGWSSFGGVPGGGRYSALDQINRSNVDKLELAWTYHTGETTGYGADIGPSFDETTPILANGLLYLCTAQNRIIALDPITGAEAWAFNPHAGLIDAPLLARHCRGVGYWQSDEPSVAKVCEKRVFKGDRIGNVFAVDADTGSPCEDFGRGGYISLSDYEYNGEGFIDLTSPPVILNNLVIIGGGVLDNVRANAPDGTIRAFDVRTGEERWHFNTIPEAMRDQTGGADVWPPFTVDVERNWVFVPTGSPSPDPYGGNRLDPVPYANALVVLDGATGELVWHRQLVHHDVFDYDLPAQPTLIDIQQGSEVIEAVAQVTKMGTVFVFRRDTGEPVFPIEEIPVPQTDIPEERTSLTQPWPTKPEPFSGQTLTEDDVWGLTFWDRGKCMEEFRGFRYEGVFTPPSIQGSLLYPSTAGGGNWGGVAYDPTRNLLVVKAHNYGFIFRLVPLTSEEAKGKPNAWSMSREMIGTPYRVEGRRWLSPLGIPCNAPPWGEMTAFDMSTGETVWRVPLGQVSVGPFGVFKTPKAWGSPNIGGPIITGGDLIFIGSTMDSVLRAVDVETGDELWSTDLPAPGMAVPMTYQAGPEGRQFVVIAATGNGIAGTELSDAYVAYALPKSASK
jgi:quinoprotein glucose dehydrogenase